MSTPATVSYTVTVHTEDDGSYWAEIPELPGCFASGFTLDELREGLQEAIALYHSHSSETARIGEMRKVEPVRMLVDEMRVQVPA